MDKLLIVKLDAIGDVLRTTSILPGVADKYRPAQIDWITSEISSELLEGNPYLGRVFIWGKHDKATDYDLVIGLEDEREICRFVAGVGAGKIIGAYLANGKIIYTPSSWFDMSLISKYGLEKANELKKLNQKTFQQHMAELLDIQASAYVFKLSPEEIEYGKKVVKDLGISSGDKVVGINTGAGKRWPQKSWGVERTIELINRMKKEVGAVSIILGGSDERERNKIISSETGMPDAGIHSLRGFASIINQCRAVLSSDSLALHFTIALRRRVVAFFGPTSAAEIELYGLGEKLSAPIDCAVCYKKSCEVKPNCMDYLSVDEVFTAVKRQ